MKGNRRHVLTLTMLFFCFLFCGCAAGKNDGPETAPDGAPKLQVVGTIFPPCDFVRQIGGDYVEVTQLLKPGMEAHSYEPSPRDVIRIAESDLFLYAGGESDVWVEELLAGNDGNTTACSLLAWVEPLEEETREGMQVSGGHHHSHEKEDLWEGEAHDGDFHEEENTHGEENTHREGTYHGETSAHGGVRLEGEYDEHVWTAPANAYLLVERIRDEMIALDPDRAWIYESNAEAYLGRLRELEAEYAETLASVGRRTLVFADRFPFLYLVRSYGLEYYAAFPGCSPQTEPAAATIAFLTDRVRQEEIPVIFYQESSDGRIAEAIAEMTGAKTRILHSCHTLTREEEERGESYLSLMERNLEMLKEALDGN